VNNPNTPAASATSATVNQLLGVNDNDVAVGFYVDGNGNSQGYQYNFSGATPTFTRSPCPPPLTRCRPLRLASTMREPLPGFHGYQRQRHGFYISGGTYTQLDNPNGTDTQAFGLNNVARSSAATWMLTVRRRFYLLHRLKTWQEISAPKPRQRLLLAPTAHW